MYATLTRNIMRRAVLHPKGSLVEIQEIIGDASNVAERLQAISRVPGMSVTAELRRDDGVVSANTQARHLGAVGLGDCISLLPGNHASPLVGRSARAGLLRSIQAVAA